ncbi:MAG: hypothetical protein E6J29_01705 [Chloroflexi bacterium]|nr:MAG: hypothetical protein E6J29_01705 [Chloroflexota bacterium]
MARKQKRRTNKARNRPPAQVVQSSSVAKPSAAAAPGGRVGGDQALVRSVEMSLGGGVQVRGKGRHRVVIESGDAGIPLERVPYFTTDLRQIAIVGSLMIVLLIVAAYTVIPLVVK